MKTTVLMMVLAVFAASLTGCAASQPKDPTAVFQPSISQSDLASYLHVSAKLNGTDGTIQYPLDAYQMSAIDVQTVEAANDIIIDRCLKKSGLSNPLTQLDRLKTPVSEDRTFGLWNESNAANYGYGTRPDPEAERGNQLLAAEPKTWGDAQAKCYATSKVLHELLYNNADSLAKDSVLAVGTSGYWESMNYAAGTKQWKAAREALWSCWQSHGLTPRTGANDWSPQVPKDQKSQIRVALVDVKCKQQTGFEQKMANIVAQYQAAYVAKHEAALNQQLVQVRKVNAEAKAIING